LNSHCHYICEQNVLFKVTL